MRTTLILLAALPVFAEPADLQPPPKPEPMPASARPAVERCEKTIAEAKKVYEAACAKAHAQAAKELEAAQKTETQKGNLDGALLIKARIEEYKADAPGATAQPSTAKSDRLIVGKWSWHQGRTAIFRADGTATQYRGAAEFGDGKWSVQKDGQIRTRWGDGKNVAVDDVEIDGETAHVVNKVGNGVKFDITKLSDDVTAPSK
jgi:hypothetical protein